jgi:hypothetical protein
MQRPWDGADPQSKESYRLCIRFVILWVILYRNRRDSLIRQGTRRWKRTRTRNLIKQVSSPNIARAMKSGWMRWKGHINKITGKMINTHGILFVRTEGKRRLVRPRHRWEDSNKIDVEYGEFIVFCRPCISKQKLTKCILLTIFQLFRIKHTFCLGRAIAHPVSR